MNVMLSLKQLVINGNIDVVLLRNGQKLFVLKHMFYGNGYCLTMNDYNDELLNKHNKSFDVVAFYTSREEDGNFWFPNSLYENLLTCIWERPVSKNDNKVLYKVIELIEGEIFQHILTDNIYIALHTLNFLEDSSNHKRQIEIELVEL